MPNCELPIADSSRRSSICSHLRYFGGDPPDASRAKVIAWDRGGCVALLRWGSSETDTMKTLKKKFSIYQSSQKVRVDGMWPFCDDPFGPKNMSSLLPCLSTEPAVCYGCCT